jgi:hypothetical protein
LAALTARAAALVRAAPTPGAREAAAAALTRFGRVSLALARDPLLAGVVYDLIVGARLICDEPQVPEPPAARRYTDAEVIEAINSSRSTKEAALKLGCNRRTLSRRRRNLGT